MGTHAKAILADSQVLSQLLAKHTRLVKDSQGDDSDFDFHDPFTLLNDRQIDDALNGPLQPFFADKLKAYAVILRIRMELKLKEDDNLKDKRAAKAKEDELPAHILESITLANLEGMEKKLNDLTEQQMQQWEEHIYQWKQNLLEMLYSSGESLSEIEIKEMQDEEPISELLERFTALSIEPPKASLIKINFENYLNLKAYLTIYSLLGRQHKPNQPNDIKLIMKSLKSVFADIRKQESALVNEQQAQTSATISSISAAIPK